jgi:hypothetical protein
MRSFEIELASGFHRNGRYSGNHFVGVLDEADSTSGTIGLVIITSAQYDEGALLSASFDPTADGHPIDFLLQSEAVVGAFNHETGTGIVSLVQI